MRLAGLGLTSPPGTSEETLRTRNSLLGQSEPDEHDGVDSSELPWLALRILGAEAPDVWPADAAAMVWRLQRKAVSSIILLLIFSAFVVMSFARGVYQWQSIESKQCKAAYEVHWWLFGHLCILAIGLVGCCSLAFPALVGWIVWGLVIWTRRHIDRCPTTLIESTQEALAVEIMLFFAAILMTCLSCSAGHTAQIAIRMRNGEMEPWEPESHLRVVNSLVDDLEMADTSIQSDDMIDSDRECVICYAPLVGTDEVVVAANCGHRFHRDCILEWLGNHRTCPLCRHRVDRPMRASERNRMLLDQGGSERNRIAGAE